MIGELIKCYHGYLANEQHYSTLTTEGYLKDLQHYLDYCREYLGEELSPSEQDAYLVDMWLNAMMRDNYKASSSARKLSAVKSFYKFLSKIGRITHSPLVGFRPPKGAKPLPVFVPTQDMQRILSDVPEDRDFVALRNHLILAMLYECGLRRSELIGLQDREVDTRERKLKVRGKGNKERIVFFGRGLAEEIEQWRQIRTEIFGTSELFFLSLRGNKMAGSEVYTIVRRHLDSVPGLARRGPHTLRHSFATDMLGNGADLKAIKELMGHSRLSSTVVYTHTSFKQIQQMYNAHHPRAKNKE